MYRSRGRARAHARSRDRPPEATLTATLVALVAGLAIVLPSLFLLFRLVLRGRFDAATVQETDAGPGTEAPGGVVRGVRGATAACLVAGVALVLFGGELASAIGALALFAFCALGAMTLLQPADLGSEPPDNGRNRSR